MYCIQYTIVIIGEMAGGLTVYNGYKNSIIILQIEVMHSIVM